MLLDEPGDYAALVGVRGVPTNIFVDADGTVLSVGAVTPGELEEETMRLLGPGADVDPPGATPTFAG